MKKAALLVGIDAYRGAPLRGCVNDVRAMIELLTERYGVPPGNTYTLTDRQATRTGILTGLQWLAAEGPDLAFFCFSGHGTRVPDLDGDETRRHQGTKFDQAIVPVDYERAGLILDDDLADIYWTFPGESRLVVHLDSCFSAKAERGIASRAGEAFNRHIRRRVDRALPARLLTEDMALTAQIRREGRGAVPRRNNLILISGCRDFETAADAYLGGRYRGAMSFHIERAIRSLNPDATYTQIVEEARRGLAADGFPQIPQLSGPAYWLRLPAYT